MAQKQISRRVYDDDFKSEAVQMLLDGHSASSVALEASRLHEHPSSRLSLSPGI